MSTVDMSGTEFRNIRKSLGLRQGDLAAIMGYSRKHICVVENELTVPPVMALAIRHLETTRQAEAA